MTNLRCEGQSGNALHQRMIVALLAIVLELMLYMPVAQGQAYCALRDPQKSIYKLFPDATQYRSIVKVIDKPIKAEVEQRLPPQSLHFSELGQHTLYVAMQNEQPLGFVHVRSEESRWGLVEVAWAMDMDLLVKDFAFQRCRTSKKKLLETDNFRRQLQGKSFADIKALLHEGTANINIEKLNLPPGSEELANVLIRNGLKTTLVTELAWRDDIDQLQFTQKAAMLFNDFVDAMGNTVTIEIIHEPYSAAVQERLHQVFANGLLGEDRRQVRLARVLDTDRQTLGSIYRHQTTIGGQLVTLWWAMDADYNVRSIRNSKGWADPRDQLVFDRVLGRTFVSVESCNNRAELMALEASVVARYAL